MITAMRASKSLWSYNPMPTSCRLYLPFWSPALRGATSGAIDPYRKSGTWVGSTIVDTGRYLDGDDWLGVGVLGDFKYLHGGEDQSNFKFTVIIWVALPTPEPNTFYGLATTCDTGIDHGIALWFEDRAALPASRQLRATIGNETAEVLNQYSDDNTYPNDTDFHMIGITYDQTLANTNYTLFVDAVNKKTGDKTVEAPTANNEKHVFQVGATLDSDPDMTGYVGEVGAWEICFTQAQMTYYYNRTKGRY